MNLNDYFDAVATAVHAMNTPPGMSGIVYPIAEAKRVMVIGNGGSAAIASHVAIDLCKSAGISATSFSDHAATTCFANDYGYDQVFAKQIERHGCGPGDVLIAISSSGKSRNILNAGWVARKRGAFVVTFSGFSPDNPLRKIGNFNFHAPSIVYGVVELAHQIFLHATTDAVAERRRAAA